MGPDVSPVQWCSYSSRVCMREMHMVHHMLKSFEKVRQSGGTASSVALTVEGWQAETCAVSELSLHSKHRQNRPGQKKKSELA